MLEELAIIRENLQGHLCVTTAYLVNLVPPLLGFIHPQLY